MSGRDENGRFIKGHQGNPRGRAPKERETRYYEITMSACTFDDWKEIVKAAVKQAKRGDHQARKWLSDYLVGVPTQPIDANVYFDLDKWEQERKKRLEQFEDGDG